MGFNDVDIIDKAVYKSKSSLRMPNCPKIENDIPIKAYRTMDTKKKPIE